MSAFKVLLVTNTLGQWGETNGIEYTYRNLLREFNSAGIPVDVLTYGPKDSFDGEGSVRVITHRPRLPVRIYSTLWIDLAVGASDIARRIYGSRYSVVHSATPDTLGMIAVKVAESCGCPLISVYHTALEYYAKSHVSYMLGDYAGEAAGYLTEQLVRWYYNHSDLILAPSGYIRDEISSWLESPVDILSRGIDIDQFSPAHRIVDPERKLPQALYVGRVAPEKNLALLVDIFKERDNVTLNVVGDGPYLSEMKRQLPDAEFAGKLTGLQLSRAYANADFFVFPSESDTFGNVVLQAKSSGLPVVVSDKMGPKEQVSHGVNGFVATDCDQFAEAVDKLIENSELRKKMGKSAREDAENYTWPRVFERLMQHYEHAISLNRFRPAVNH